MFLIVRFSKLKHILIFEILTGEEEGQRKGRSTSSLTTHPSSA